MPEQRPVSRPVPRIDALRLISQRFPDDPVVFTCGATSREIASLERRENHLCVVDSMGLVSSITLGLGLGLEEFPERRVVGVEGDGGMLANLNSLATIGYLQPGNLLLIVLDNESYGSTGGQATFTTRLDLADHCCRDAGSTSGSPMAWSPWTKRSPKPPKPRGPDSS